MPRTPVLMRQEIDEIQAAAGVRALPHVRTGHPLTDPLALTVTFYAVVERRALVRGIDPDMARHLMKLTGTT